MFKIKLKYIRNGDNIMRYKRLKNRNVFIIILCLSVLAVGIVSFYLTKNTVVYEISEKSKNTIADTSGIYEDIGKIPELKDGYLIIYKNNILYVYSKDEQLLYKETDINESVFSSNDIAQLSQNGMQISGLTELTEILNYLKS